MRRAAPAAAPAALQLELPLVAPPRRDAAGATTRAIRLGSRMLTYRFARARRRTIGLTVDRHGLAARAPRWIALAEVEAFIREKETWILARLAELPALEAPAIAWRDGTRLAVFGAPVALRLAPGRTVALAGDELRVPLVAAAPDAMRRATIDWLRARALAFYRERVAALAPCITVALPRIALSNARTQWGSCTVARDGTGRVRLHWRLVQLPPAVIDYVIAHELAHLREMNHSPRFWRWVERMLPDYRTAQRELRRLARELPEL